jgi:hypothetical protein
LSTLSQEDTQLLVGARLREELSAVGMGVTEAAQICEVARNTVYAWFESGGISAWQLSLLVGKGLDGHFILTGEKRKAALQVDFSSEDIAYQLDEAEFVEIRERAQKYASERLTIDAAVELVRSGAYVWVPYYDVPLAGGHGHEWLGKPAKWNFYRREYFDGRPDLSIIDLAEFPSTGRSMSPVLQPKDTLMVDRSQTVPTGDIYALRQDTLLMVKYLQVLPSGNIQATSKQADEFPPFEITKADLESGHAEVIGRVVRQGRDH